METKTADLADARQFADAIHAVYPDKMLAYNLSPSFNWDTTGMSDDEMRRFPEELGKMGFVFNFITYGGHQIDGVAAEEFAPALKQDGMLALARLQRKMRLVESPYRTPQTLVGGPRRDAALAASSGRTATTKAMGKGSTQHQHLCRPRCRPRCSAGGGGPGRPLGPRPPAAGRAAAAHAGSDLPGDRVADDGRDVLANVVFAEHRRPPRADASCRSATRTRPSVAPPAPDDAGPTVPRAPLRGLVGPLPEARPTTTPRGPSGCASSGSSPTVQTEIGQIIVGQVDRARVAVLVAPDSPALGA